MLKNLHCKCLIVFLLSVVSSHAMAVAGCSGRFPNPVTDVCWQCMYANWMVTLLHAYVPCKLDDLDGYGAGSVSSPL